MSNHPTRCENCSAIGETFDRTAQLENTHSGELSAEPVELCRSCRDAFDLGAGNA